MPFFGGLPTISHYLKEVRKLIGNSSSVFVSAASAWEIATKVRIGKLPEGADLAADFQGFLFRNRFESLPINSEHAIRAGLLPGPIGIHLTAC
jgi:PIN domain nuclease of toxin-antitoxin system